MRFIHKKTGQVVDAERFFLNFARVRGQCTDDSGDFVTAVRDGYTEKAYLSDGDIVICDPDQGRGYHRLPPHVFAASYRRFNEGPEKS